MAFRIIDTSMLSAEANALRKKGIQGQIEFKNNGFADAISTITEGIPQSGVVFLDYDNSIIEVWNTDDVSLKTQLPQNPSHNNLIAQGWNQDLSSIQTYINNYPEACVYVGQMYKTVSGLSEFDITVTPITGKTVVFKMTGTKDWGDGTSSSATSHTYENYGNYTIKCNGTSIPAGTASPTLGGLFGSNNVNGNRYWCTEIRLGEDVTLIGNYSFYCCYQLTKITIPQSVIKIGNNAFNQCYNLKNIIVPKNVTTLNNYTFNSCINLEYVSIPASTISSFGSYTFYNCNSLKGITIPLQANSIQVGCFSNCYAINNIVIPSNINVIEQNAFLNLISANNIILYDGVTSIEDGSFYGIKCSQIKFPKTLLEIGQYVFNQCFTTILYDFSDCTSIPSLLNINAFNSISGISKIKVPFDLYENWKNATNWSTYSNYIYTD